MNPCNACGACCAAYRVDFHRLDPDLDTAPGGAEPAGLTFPLTANLVRMRGTDACNRARRRHGLAVIA